MAGGPGVRRSPRGHHAVGYRACGETASHLFCTQEFGVRAPAGPRRSRDRLRFPHAMPDGAIGSTSDSGSDDGGSKPPPAAEPPHGCAPVLVSQGPVRPREAALRARTPTGREVTLRAWMVQVRILPSAHGGAPGTRRDRGGASPAVPSGRSGPIGRGTAFRTRRFGVRIPGAAREARPGRIREQERLAEWVRHRIADPWSGSAPRVFDSRTLRVMRFDLLRCKWCARPSDTREVPGSTPGGRTGEARGPPCLRGRTSGRRPAGRGAFLERTQRGGRRVRGSSPRPSARQHDSTEEPADGRRRQRSRKPVALSGACGFDPHLLR